MGHQPTDQQIQDAYEMARDRYAGLGVDTDKALDVLARIPISLHCWQGDDVGGFENTGEALSGGIAATGNYPGKARNADELRSDLDKAYSLIPGTHRLNLHACMPRPAARGSSATSCGRSIFPRGWSGPRPTDMASTFNPTLFSHPKAASGFTLSSYDAGIRQFWIEHCIACRKIGEHMGRELGTPCVTNIWIPDGFKDTPVDRKTPRLLLQESLDKIFAEKTDRRYNLDAVEAKLFGIGSESYVVGSHEFYLGYAVANKVLLTLDAGHFHPTEVISDKLSAVLTFVDEVLLHVSRGVRWDSDHVVILSDELEAIAQEIVRGGYLNRVHIGLDYFDASINRIAAWVIGSRNMLRALLLALVEPIDSLRKLEVSGDYTRRLALLEELKALPSGAVWDYFCLRQGVPVGIGFMDEIQDYEQRVL